MRCRALAIVLVLAALPGCSPRDLLKEFEYDEEVYLQLDGSASVIVNASIPALIALRNLALDPDPGAPVDRAVVRAAFTGPGVAVTRVSRPWRRHGRRFVQVRLDVDDVRRLSAASAFAWSAYRLDRQDGTYMYRQIVNAPTGPPVDRVGWSGSELIAFRLHLPSRIVFHNSPSRRVERGNIVSWEQPLRDRLAGRPVDIEVRMESQSILYRTLTIFGAAAVAALTLLAAAIYWVWRKGRQVESKNLQVRT